MVYNFGEIPKHMALLLLACLPLPIAMSLQRPMAVAVSAQCSHLQTALSFRSRTPTTQSLSLLRRRPSSRHQQQRTSTVVAVFKSRTAKATTTKQKKKQPRVEDGIGFTKENELFVGRVAMLGFAVSLLGEAVTGKGILAQLNLETGIPITEAEPLLLFFILFTLLGAIGALGDRGRFVDDATGLECAVIPPGRGFRAALGLSEGGPLFGILFFLFAAINPGTGRFVTDDGIQ